MNNSSRAKTSTHKSHSLQLLKLCIKSSFLLHNETEYLLYKMNKKSNILLSTLSWKKEAILLLTRNNLRVAGIPRPKEKNSSRTIRISIEKVKFSDRSKEIRKSSPNDEHLEKMHRKRSRPLLNRFPPILFHQYRPGLLRVSSKIAPLRLFRLSFVSIQACIRGSACCGAISPTLGAISVWPTLSVGTKSNILSAEPYIKLQQLCYG